MNYASYAVVGGDISFSHCHDAASHAKGWFSKFERFSLGFDFHTFAFAISIVLFLRNHEDFILLQIFESFFLRDVIYIETNIFFHYLTC